MPPGVGAIAPDAPHVARPFGSRPSNPLYKRSCILSPIRTVRSIADVVTTPADVYDAEHPLTPTWWLVLSDPKAPRIKYPNRLVDWERAVTSRAYDTVGPVVPSRGLVTRTGNDRPRLVVISRVPSLVTRLHSSRLKGTRGYPSGSTRLHPTCVVVTSKCLQTHDTSGRTPLFLATSGLGDRYVFKHGTVNQGIRVVSMPMRNPRNHPRWIPKRQVPLR